MFNHPDFATRIRVARAMFNHHIKYRSSLGNEPTGMRIRYSESAHRIGASAPGDDPVISLHSHGTGNAADDELAMSKTRAP